MPKNTTIDPLPGGHNCPSCPKCPRASTKREKPKGKLATALIGAAIGTIGFGMLTLGGRRSGR